MTPTNILTTTATHVRETLAGDSSGHDWWHIDRVRRNALLVAREEGADLFVTELAALLHDIADWKFHGGDDTAGPRAAREWLIRCEADAGLIEQVCEIIATLSFKGAGVGLTPDEPFARRARSGRVVSAVKLPVGDVVQQRGQFGDE